MPISKLLLQNRQNHHVVIPSWFLIHDWLNVMACHPTATPLIDFDKDDQFMRVRATALNWWLMDVLGLREQWYAHGWQARTPLWLLINPMRYILLRHQPRRPYAYDVMDYLREHRPHLLQQSLVQHPYFVVVPAVYQHKLNNYQAIDRAEKAPWRCVTVLNRQDDIIGMLWAEAAHPRIVPPIMNRPTPLVNRTNSGDTRN